MKPRKEIREHSQLDLELMRLGGWPTYVPARPGGRAALECRICRMAAARLAALAERLEARSARLAAESNLRAAAR